MNKDLGKTSTGIQANIAGLLCYGAGFISGIIFFLIEKENKFVRFHAFQSMITFGALFLLQQMFMFTPLTMPFLAMSLLPLISLGGLALWIVLMYKAYQGETFKLPVIGDFAEKKVSERSS